MALKWGILSCGKISSDFVSALSSFSDTEHKVVACAARSIESAQLFANQFKISKAYGSYEELVADPEVQVTYVGAVNTQHVALVKLALENGKHVLCEKPMGINVREVKEMVECARSKKLFLMEGIWSRFFPVYQRLREELATGIIGDIVQVTTEFGTLLAHKDRCRLKELGGGTVLDIGVYNVQFISLIMGGQRPEKIVASGILNDDGVDDCSNATLIYPNKKVATVITNGRCKMENSAVVYGTQGRFKVPMPFWCPTTLVTPYLTDTFELPTCKLKMNYRNSEGLAYEAEEVRKCLKEGLTESPLMSLDESLVIAEIMESIRKQVGVVYPQDNVQ